MMVFLTQLRDGCFTNWLTIALLAFTAYMAAPLLYEQWTGVFTTESSDLNGEARVFAMRLGLQPGMTLCEMGSANGAIMAKLVPYVMPGGSFVATSISTAELRATRQAVARALHVSEDDAPVATYLATSTQFAPGLPDGTCDALYSRMVIHMIPKETINGFYVAEWRAALKSSGTMFMTDHNPLDGGPLSGPRRPIFFAMMPVVPQETEVAEITAHRGEWFSLVDGPFEHAFYAGGYGAVYRPAARVRALPPLEPPPLNEVPPPLLANLTQERRR